MTTNVDPLEIAKFSALAERWWDPQGEFRPLHAINPLRLEWIDKQASLQGKRVLDVGCGGGILSESMARRGASVLGLDLGEAPLAVARQHAEQQGIQIDYRAESVEALAQQQPQHYDVVTCMEMLEHVPDPLSVVQSCQKLLKPGGMAFFSTINRNPKSWLFAIVGAEYVLQMLPRGTHDYRRFIKPSELGSWIRSSSMQIEDLIGLHFNPLLQHYWLAENVDVNYMLSARNARTDGVA